ncbi:hypothetical protein GUITHDRAFT_121743 [Guillardia theta CCMP2712]|uniref:Mitochondrial carrier protein n=1 Tax=Guillardia theta (strain CCMP2712) TaxID=905079 RepID=L1I8A8_GUITC|nr:hypothetical protein GUITHDRAFT_121743 [Guillardia theta CCMP2712]EKX32090.1 hypothetical protein GUITHDRAFT_121743 [Guillardia theta CCMP2712]|eukprot:XP_005819070.1 hypothetical protein GUITHDRAFT_121743 [Guillardia theta CCMP2712]
MLCSWSPARSMRLLIMLAFLHLVGTERIAEGNPAPHRTPFIAREARGWHLSFCSLDLKQHRYEVDDDPLNWNPNLSFFGKKEATDPPKSTVHINPCALITDFITARSANFHLFEPEKKPKEFVFPAGKKKDKEEPIEVIRWSEVTPWKVVVADSLATCIEKCVMYPLDTLRTRMQMDPSKKVSLLNQASKRSEAGKENSVELEEKEKENEKENEKEEEEEVESFDLGSHKENLDGGVEDAVQGRVRAPHSAANCWKRHFRGQGWFKEMIEKRTGKVDEGSPFAPLIAAMASETICTIFEVPHDVITQRMQHAALPFTRSLSTPSRGYACLKSILSQEGFLALYKGPPVHMAAGMTAGFIAAAVCNPIDVVKTRIQCDPHLKGQSIMKVAKGIVGREGPQALFKGLAIALLFDCLVSAGGGIRYEMVMGFSKKAKTEDEQQQQNLQENDKNKQPLRRSSAME